MSLIGTLQSTVEAVVQPVLYVYANANALNKISSFVTDLLSKNILDKSVQGKNFLVDPST